MPFLLVKFAHRKCIQRWCNKKGDITCEICSQAFSPNYFCPPPRGNADVLTIDIRQAWEAHTDLQHPRLSAFTEAERQILQSEYNGYSMENSRALTCFRSLAIILMLLLLIHQTFMVKLDIGMPQESSVFFHYQISIVQLAGFLLPCYVVARSWYFVLCRRRRQVRAVLAQTLPLISGDSCEGWHKPSLSWIKVNVDAVFFPSANSTGFGMILRDNLGMFVAVRSCFMPENIRVEKGKVMGLHEALSWIKYFEKVIF
ncbi:hypothetical protein C2S53_007295 [Perilla frutescens var. hirtella]|uniref:RING-CH-type domain-containing protein n=1 Tax=Perilla frutescens var. hirtella TaxID=608512 RepID=A0AAD4PCJ4_PERFH|nr:hypothetical protein C2S53_007295 [Perilla frutescens var. hirtella]